MNSSARQLRALIVDEQDLFRVGLRLLLQDTIGIQSIVETGNVGDALGAVASPDVPDLVTFDLSLPGKPGLAALAKVLDAFPTARVLVIAASEEPSDILAVLSAGAHGFVPKTFSSEQIADAIGRVMAGQIFVPFSLSASRPGAPAPSAANLPEAAELLQFTPGQSKVLELLMAGASTRRIAFALNIGEGTVKTHIAAIYRAASVHSRSEVIVKLRSLGWRVGHRQQPE